MSLVSNEMVECQMIDKTTQPDGYGGVMTVWADGAKFQAAVVLASAQERIVAAQEGTHAQYGVLTTRNICLMYGDLFRRVSDGKLFRVKSDGTDNKTPKNARLDLRRVEAEEIDSLPNGEA